jgi:metallo-beta-lactamase class B
MLSSHAHFDHIEGHAMMQKLTGAQVMAMVGDAEALSTGKDNSALGAIGWEPVKVARVLKNGDTVSLGGTTLRAVHTPGHTQGATSWITTVEDNGRRYTVGFLGGTTPNGGVPLFDNPRHKSVIEDTQRTFATLKGERPPDIYLVGHPQAMFMARWRPSRREPHRIRCSTAMRGRSRSSKGRPALQSVSQRNARSLENNCRRSAYEDSTGPKFLMSANR